ncbi:MAG: YggS family pyridoxal phosphate-dependent enzyme [Bacillota bacterium]|nr:YggS family pyridoxal phosphate-dependent enzyme [Bacillota bacterium]
MSIKENIEMIQKDIPPYANLIAVSKTRTIDEIKEAYETGVRDFGENKVQELIDKTENLNSDIRWHLIGHLQTNKVKYIVGKVHLIHSLDSIKLLEEIEKRYSIKGINANVLIQINIGREESKTGILVEDLNELLKACEACCNVKVRGLMSIIPKGDDETCRKYFKEMKAISDDIKKVSYKNITMDYLSIGMTGDYKLAILEGSNMIRVGEGIFGKRNYKL